MWSEWIVKQHEFYQNICMISNNTLITIKLQAIIQGSQSSNNNCSHFSESNQPKVPTIASTIQQQRKSSKIQIQQLSTNDFSTLTINGDKKLTATYTTTLHGNCNTTDSTNRYRYWYHIRNKVTIEIILNTEMMTKAMVIERHEQWMTTKNRNQQKWMTHYTASCN